METQVFGAFRGRKRGAGVEQAVKAPKPAPEPVQAAPAPAAKKRRGSTQPKITQALQRAAAVPRTAEAGGSDGIATQLLRSEAEEQPAATDAAHAGAGGLDPERADADAAAAPDTQPQVEARVTTHGVSAPACAAPLVAGHAAVDAAAGLTFEHEVRAALCAAPRRSRASHRPLPPFTQRACLVACACACARALTRDARRLTPATRTRATTKTRTAPSLLRCALD